MNSNQETQIEEEIVTMRKMISIYCRGNHQTSKDQLCDECNTLLEYALARIDQCTQRDTKEFCSNCTVHCYRPDMRQHIRTVMRYSGPRMLYHAPVLAFKHMRSVMKRKRDAGNTSE